MAISAQINLKVPALPDNDIWFANSAAWSNYWQNITFEADFDPADVTAYVPTPYVESNPVVFNIDGNPVVLVTKAMFDSLLTELQTLNSSYQLLRQELYNAGFIDDL